MIRIHYLDILSNDGQLDGIRFTEKFNNMIFHGELARADSLLAALRQDGLVPDALNQRLRNAKNLLSDTVKTHAAVRQERGSLEEVLLSEAEDRSSAMPSEHSNPFCWGPGLYTTQSAGRRISTFDQDFQDEDDSLREVLIRCGFNREILESPPETLRVASDVSACATHPQMYAFPFSGRIYDRNNSSRVAKNSRVNFMAATDRVIDEAVILSVPHHVGNYYHSLAEMAYGLLSINTAWTDGPIIFTEDRFGLISTVCEILGIPTERLLPIRGVSSTLIKKAVMLWPSYYYWSRRVFERFSALNLTDESQTHKIYISRKFSSRSFTNEDAVEDFLRGRGFRICHAQNLSIREQIATFAGATHIISPHGAGLANIAFSGPGTTLVEIFDEQFIQPDFYLRSRHRDVRYFAQISRNNTVNLEALAALVDRILEYR